MQEKIDSILAEASRVAIHNYAHFNEMRDKSDLTKCAFRELDVALKRIEDRPHRLQEWVRKTRLEAFNI